MDSLNVQYFDISQGINSQKKALESYVCTSIPLEFLISRFITRYQLGKKKLHTETRLTDKPRISAQGYRQVHEVVQASSIQISRRTLLIYADIQY